MTPSKKKDAIEEGLSRRGLKVKNDGD